MARNSSWKRLMESTEGPTVQVALPREWAEQLLSQLAQSLEMDDMGGDDSMGLDDMGDDDMDFGAGDEGGDDPAELDFGADDMLAAGDDDEEEAPSGPGPGRPPGSKNKPKADKKKSDDKPKKDKKPESDEDEDDEKDEAADYSGGHANGMRPQTALGESARRLGAYIAPRRRTR